MTLFHIHRLEKKKQNSTVSYINENSKEIENLKVTTNHSHTHTSLKTIQYIYIPRKSYIKKKKLS